MKKAQVSTDTPIVLTILVFQTFVVTALGFLTIANEDVTATNAKNIFFSFGNIVNNIAILGWGNALIFAPLIIVLLYILAKLIRGGG